MLKCFDGISGDSLHSRELFLQHGELRLCGIGQDQDGVGSHGFEWRGHYTTMKTGIVQQAPFRKIKSDV